MKGLLIIVDDKGQVLMCVHHVKPMLHMKKILLMMKNSMQKYNNHCSQVNIQMCEDVYVKNLYSVFNEP